MERPKDKLVIRILIILYSVGVLGHIADGEILSLMKVLTPFVLLLSGGLVLFSLELQNNKPLAIWLIAGFLFTMIIEILGVKSGLIFGNYYYGYVLGVKLFGVPVIIGINWIMIIWGGIGIGNIAGSSIFSKSFLAAFMILVFDLILEPVAMKLSYWHWQGGIIPLKNYSIWFLIGFFLSFGYFRANIKIKTDLPIALFVIQIFFFILINLFH